MCDIIIASDTAKFGQPEITLGTIPGIGGTQRLTRAIGKAKAMDLCLTGRMMDAAEAEKSGLVARILPAEGFVDAVLAIAAEIAAMPRQAAMLNKEMVNVAFETTLEQGLLFERRTWSILAATEDKAEGMNAFVEKRPAVWKGK
jgi:enoyl-CoA hydratase